MNSHIVLNQYYNSVEMGGNIEDYPIKFEPRKLIGNRHAVKLFKNPTVGVFKDKNYVMKSISDFCQS